MNLYEIGQNFLYLASLLQDEETDQQLILDTLESIEGEFEDKADNYAKIIKSLESEVSALKEEETRLANRRKSRENNIKLLKTNLENVMKATNKTNFKTLLFNFNIAKNGGKAPLKIDIPVEKIPVEYFKERTEKDLNNDLIRKALDEGKITFAHYEERGESLRIK
jgi:hypothetical protein